MHSTENVGLYVCIYYNNFKQNIIYLDIKISSHYAENPKLISHSKAVITMLSFSVVSDSR